MSNNLVPIIPPIDIKANADRTQEILNLLMVKYDLLLDRVEPLEQKGELSWEYFDYMIELWQIQHCIQQKRLEPIIPQFDAALMYVLDKKLKWMNTESSSSDSRSHIKFIREYYFTELYIKEGYFGVSVPRDDKKYEDVLDQELQILDHLIHSTIDDRIRVFYITQELKTRSMAHKTTIKKQKSDRLIDQKVKNYDQIIDLLSEKKRILQGIVNSKDSDELLKVNTKLEIIKIQREIESKQEFRKRYVQRKNIIS